MNMKKGNKRILIGIIGLLTLSSFIIALNIQIGFTAFENIGQVHNSIMLFLVIIMVIITILITTAIIHYELKYNVRKFEEESMNKKLKEEEYKNENRKT